MATTKTVPSDFSDLVAAFEAEGVEYLVVGGHAVGAHARPRATKSFAEAHSRAIRFAFGEQISVPFIALDDLIAKKGAAGRALDRADAEVLERVRDRRAR